MTFTKFLILSINALVGLCGSVYAANETDWPKKPVLAIVSFPAGGSTDIFARSLTAPLSDALGQSIVVENSY
jgi:tripartite-type tricarboxylate transporter receptor subunit TctC